MIDITLIDLFVAGFLAMIFLPVAFIGFLNRPQ